MEMELKTLIEKIKHEGVDRAEADALKIIENAGKKADDIVSEASRKGDDIVAAAKREAESFQKASETALRQVSRDLMLELRGRIMEFLTRVANNRVEEALQPAVLTGIIVTAVKSAMEKGVEDIEVVLDEKDMRAIENDLFAALRKDAREHVLLKDGGGIKSGFRIGAKDAGSYLDFTGQAIAEWFMRHLNPRIVKAIDAELELGKGVNDK